MTWQERWALAVVYGGLPVLLLAAALDDGPAEQVVTAACLFYGVSAMCLFVTARGRDAMAGAFVHQNRTFSKAFRR